MSALEISHLSRSYITTSGYLRRRRKTVAAVRDISLNVEEGEIFGLLGPNGAGKTTTIRVLTTLLLPTTGSVRIFGQDVTRDPRSIRRRIGYVFGGDRGLYERLSARDNLRYFAELFQVDWRTQRTRIPYLLELVGLEGRDRERVESFSKGMKQRLHIARGLIHDPRLIILDEPSIGLDPVGARELRNTVSTLRNEGRTVLLTTHYMFEADELCQRIAIIGDGRLLSNTTPAELKSQVSSGHVIDIEVFGSPTTLLERVERIDGVRSATLSTAGESQSLCVHVLPGYELTSAILSSTGSTLTGKVARRDPTLEDAYVALISKASHHSDRAI